MATDLLLRGGRVGLGGTPADLLLRDGTVVAVGPVGSMGCDAEIVSVGDATVLPGFVDSHVHVDQWVHDAHRVDVRAARDPANVVALLSARRDRDSSPGRVLTGHGFTDGLWAEAPDRGVLDAAFGDLPVAVISSDLHVVWLNGAALALLGREDHPTGVLREQECMVAVRGLMDAEPADVVDGWVSEALRAAAARGVTGLVDFEYADNLTTWARRASVGPLDAQVAVAVWLPWLDAAVAAGLRTGDPVVADASVVVGPFKLMADGSLNSRTAHCHDAYAHAEPGMPHGLALLTRDELVAHLTRAVVAGFEPAVHAIGDAANTAALDAFEKVGCRGRIEHAQLVCDEDLARFAALGVVASVQPQHAVADRDVADHHWRGRTGRAFPFGALHAAGAALRLGSDAPVSPVDPWRAVVDAVTRTDDARPPWHPEQVLPLDVAVAAACAGRRRVGLGDVADLVVVSGDPATATADALPEVEPLLTVRAGRVTHRVV